VGVIFESSDGALAVGGRIMKMTREQLFAAPKVVRARASQTQRCRSLSIIPDESIAPVSSCAS
jgi:hypothetical protein